MKKIVIAAVSVVLIIAAFVIFFAMQTTPGNVLNKVRAEELEVVDGTVTIPEKYTVIEEEAFAGKIDFDSVIIKGETEIGDRAFYGCPNLKEVLIEKNCDIGASAFGSCSQLMVVTIESKGGRCAENAFDGHGGVLIRCPEDSPAFIVARVKDLSYSIIDGNE